MAAGPSDLLHALALLCGQLVLQRQLCHAQNGVERCADFMAHHRDEAGALLCCPFCRLFGDGHGVRLALLLGHVHPHAVKQHAAIRQPPRGGRGLQPARCALVLHLGVKVQRLGVAQPFHERGLDALAHWPRHGIGLAHRPAAAQQRQHPQPRHRAGLVAHEQKPAFAVGLQMELKHHARNCAGQVHQLFRKPARLLAALHLRRELVRALHRVLEDLQRTGHGAHLVAPVCGRNHIVVLVLREPLHDARQLAHRA